MIAKHRDDELEHREIGLKNDAENVRNISIPALLTQSVFLIAVLHSGISPQSRHLS
jgi:demethoxyubiquinone hydroxylase (CLK1/Coq7/Cat5 family)